MALHILWGVCCVCVSLVKEHACALGMVPFPGMAYAGGGGMVQLPPGISIPHGMTREQFQASLSQMPNRPVGKKSEKTGQNQRVARLPRI